MALLIEPSKLCIPLIRYYVQKKALKTAGIIVIGDEILKGAVLDTNSNYIMRSLYDLGIKVCKVSVIGDSIKVISDEIKLYSREYNYVITTGGIGPTHDDVTFEAIANAFGEQLFPHPQLVDICQQYFKCEDLQSPGMKLAYVPKSAKLKFGESKKLNLKMNYPNICVRNVYIFPGIPILLRKSIDLLGAELFASDSKFYTRSVYLNVKEDKIVNVLNQLVSEYPDVIFGSYPEMQNSQYEVKITIESQNEKSTENAANKFLELVPKNNIIKQI